MARFRSFISCLILMVLLLPNLLGCARDLIVRADIVPMKRGMVKSDFIANGTIKLVNGYTAPKNFFIGKFGELSFYVELKNETETAISLLSTELAKRGILVDENAEKELKVSMINSNFSSDFMNRCIMTLSVKTGDGFSGSFEGNGTTPGSIYRACGGGITKAVAPPLY